MSAPRCAPGEPAWRLQPPAGRRRQGGFSLIGMALALAITTAVAIWASNEVVHRIEASAAQSTGVWMTQIRLAVTQMLSRHAEALSEGKPPLDGEGQPLFAQALQPSLAELRAQGLLPADFPNQSALGFGADIHIARSQTCPGDPCRLDGIVYADRPLLKKGSQVPDEVAMASVVASTDGYGGAVWPQAPAQLRGAAYGFPNPLAAGAPTHAPGTLALWAGAGAGLPDLSGYVKMRDTRDPDLQGGLTVAGSVETGGYVNVGAREVPGHACGAQPGALAKSAAGQLLSCESGVWMQASGGFGGAFSVNYPLGCFHYTGISTANPRTGQCACPTGYESVVVSSGGVWKGTEGWTIGYVCVR
ncbi:type II secretion system protein J [Achromobacter sp. GbtcB20]|uniref:PulJ/GspJ family protein n=1 Tax=Achromobacter sp. GbtcB20 TaxID=2824765 RepID=UPI0020C73F9D|nr:prepilin [Achromobacter sp. GbtcB20]